MPGVHCFPRFSSWARSHGESATPTRPVLGLRSWSPARARHVGVFWDALDGILRVVRLTLSSGTLASVPLRCVAKSSIGPLGSRPGFPPAPPSRQWRWQVLVRGPTVESVSLSLLSQVLQPSSGLTFMYLKSPLIYLKRTGRAHAVGDPTAGISVCHYPGRCRLSLGCEHEGAFLPSVLCFLHYDC